MHINKGLKIVKKNLYWDYNYNFSEFPIEMADFYDDKEVIIYLDEIKKYKDLTQEEEQSLFEKIKENDNDAMLEVFHCNLKFAASIASKFSRLSLSIMPMDLIQEANLALLDAIKSYNKARCIYFKNYAEIIIKKRLFEVMKKDGKMLRFSSYEFNKITKVSDIIQRCTQEFGRFPFVDEICYEDYGYDSSVDIYDEKDMEVFINARNDILSIDTLEEENLGSYDIEQQIDDLSYREKLIEIIKIANLTQEEKTIIYYLYIDSRQRTVPELTNYLNMSYEEIRKIRNKAIKKLNRYSYLLLTKDKVYKTMKK